MSDVTYVKLLATFRRPAVTLVANCLQLFGRLFAGHAEEVLADLAHLDLLGALGDPVAAVVAVDVLEGHVAAVADAPHVCIARSAASHARRFAR